MLTATAYGLAAVLDLFVLFIGARFLLRPRPAAAGYGVPAKPDGDAAYLEIKGLRDATFGILGLVLLVFAGARPEAWFMLVVALAPLGDTLIVLRHGGTRAVAFGIHFATAVVVLASAALLFAV
ncbi:hypothetical protein AQJ43_32905 [Streptomyces avermitilis]|uniref:Membrane protein n=2 Tax=Streptomyces avermitilis TaxID=33903 RepID=Q82BI0_STRAW|nr:MULTISPECIES: DUF4267 domain-containing protein [Streptomyces]KUN50354.1 hypothetical protein AQJ43_32905 [Streptomyces avermitilis]MYT01297.1 DUF4267 domain-containing protein [Streptomyces sp. SID5469]OOV30892.1 hypothetical protein SM007_17115 [Streptomyces avermitilis]BAC73437.1 putative membrane protein [Streptomyces avermitilis MA-4680 = NBRC 14893]BBJ53910.1 membrane protein [Streptomyces avermitilis]